MHCVGSLCGTLIHFLFVMWQLVSIGFCFHVLLVSLCSWEDWLESGLENENAHWEHDPPYYTCCTFQEEPWANHEGHITFPFFLWEGPLEEFEKALHGSWGDGLFCIVSYFSLWGWGETHLWATPFIWSKHVVKVLLSCIVIYLYIASLNHICAGICSKEGHSSF